VRGPSHGVDLHLLSLNLDQENRAYFMNYIYHGSNYVRKKRFEKLVATHDL
jgi:hypothetical protein